MCKLIYFSLYSCIIYFGSNSSSDNSNKSPGDNNKSPKKDNNKPPKKDKKVWKEVLDPHFVSGFVDAEGSFSIFVFQRPTWSTNPVFRIHLHLADAELLCRIQSFFGGIGSLVFVSNRVSWIGQFSDFLLGHLHDLAEVKKPWHSWGRLGS